MRACPAWDHAEKPAPTACAPTNFACTQMTFRATKQRPVNRAGPAAVRPAPCPPPPTAAAGGTLRSPQTPLAAAGGGRHGAGRTAAGPARLTGRCLVARNVIWVHSKLGGRVGAGFPWLTWGLPMMSAAPRRQAPHQREKTRPYTWPCNHPIHFRAVRRRGERRRPTRMFRENSSRGTTGTVVPTTWCVVRCR